MRLTREQAREQTRERLIESARVCMMRQGYDGTSIGDIAEEAGFTKGAFFSNFDSKEALLQEMMRRHKAEQIEALRHVLGESDGSSWMTPEVECYYSKMDADCGWTLLDVELELQATRNPAFGALYSETERAFRAGVGNLIEGMFTRAGRVLPGKPEEIGGLLVAMVRGLVLASRADPAHPQFSQQIKLVLKSLLMSAPPTA